MRTRGCLCFLAPYVYAVATRGKVEFVGGTEVRQWALARALAQRGFDVTMATCDFGQDPVVVCDGVRLLRTFAVDAGVPALRFFYPRMWRTLRTLHGADAQVYLANGAGLAPGWTYDAARLRNAKFVFLSSSDGDAMRSLPWVAKRWERWWYLRALRGADARIAQTESQRLLFRENFAVETQVIPNPVDLPASQVDPGANHLVLWLSTYKAEKRPEWFTELARRLPQLKFLMIGLPLAANESWQAARRAAADCPNLEVVGFVDHADIGEFFRGTALFVHTSPLEGFPMTLLEAWSYGIPSVTTFDPGGVIERHGIGSVVESFEQLTGEVQRLMAAPDTRRALGMRAREYVKRYHGPQSTYDPLAILLDRIVEDGRRTKKLIR
jgi:glycosyltransferase involved in cell wall biosynthesis